MTIDISVKKKCVELSMQGNTARSVYNEYFTKVHEGMGYETFRAKLKQWKKRSFADESTIESGTYPGFTAHNATVQVNGEGKITQAWIKQAVDDVRWDELLDAIKEHTQSVLCVSPATDNGEGMLEIPLYDMHFPLSDHSETIGELLGIIQSRHRQEINIIIGQDLLHNDDFRGRTSSGRPIERVDIAQAWRMAREFWERVIKSCAENADRVNVIYSKGNHDESLAWAFVQMLRAMFPTVAFDDSMKQRKVIFWDGCFIGVTHGNGAKTQNNDLRGQFTIEFPEQFAKAAVREIHCGHLHHEREADLYGVMLRRLSRSGVTDEWSDDEGFVGAHKRFMVFDWMPSRLKAIYYV